MKKKLSFKKLILNKLTVTNLNPDGMDIIKGGVITQDMTEMTCLSTCHQLCSGSCKMCTYDDIACQTQ